MPLKLGKNLDFWIKPSLDNARRIIRALKIFGTPMRGIQPEKLAGMETQFTLKCHPYLLEFYTPVPGLEFDKAFESRVLCREVGCTIHLLSESDLALTRSSVNRPPDDEDPDEIG